MHVKRAGLPAMAEWVFVDPLALGPVPRLSTAAPHSRAEHRHPHPPQTPHEGAHEGQADDVHTDG